MITHFLGPDEVKAYACDLADRLVRLGADIPKTWFLLGVSGQTFAAEVLNHIPEPISKELKLVRVQCNRETKEVAFADSFDKTEVQRGSVLLIDSSVHSGQTMLAVSKELSSLLIPDIITYGLVLKRNSSLVPNYFGVLLEEGDRCLFQLNSIPNNRLCKKIPFGILRILADSDINASFPDIGETAVETNFASLLYERETHGSQIFVYEHAGNICGVLSFKRRGNSLFVDLVANSKNYRNKGIGAALMRWAETWARSTKCEAVELWAIEKRVDFYKSRKFVDMDKELDLGDAKFKLMRRKLLYNTSMVGETA